MRSSGLRDTGVLLLGAGIGAGIMFLLDPRGGGYRRALIRDKFVSFGKDTASIASKRSRDLMHRARGKQYELRNRNERVDDETLVERVRAQIGHAVSHPGAIEVEVIDGLVFVKGPVLRGERRDLHDRLNKTRGVQQCDLGGVHEHDSTENIPALQGGSSGHRRVGS